MLIYLYSLFILKIALIIQKADCLYLKFQIQFSIKGENYFRCKGIKNKSQKSYLTILRTK